MDGRNRSTALLVIVVLLLIMCCCCLAGMYIQFWKFVAINDNVYFLSDFAEVPSPVTINVSENHNALFRCRHERSDALYNWLINGIPSTRYSDVSVSSVSENNGTFVDTLTIPAIPVYNGTEVVCVATLFDGSPERTPPVTLIITGLLQQKYTLDTMAVSTCTQCTCK